MMDDWAVFGYGASVYIAWEDGSKSKPKTVRHGFCIPIPFKVHNLYFDDVPLVKPNKASLRIDSEPQGAKIYQAGIGYMGTTPYTATYTLCDSDYNKGFLSGKTLTILYPGAAPEEYLPVLGVDQNTKPDPKIYSTGGKVFNYHKLVIFKSASNTVLAPPPPIQPSRENQTIVI